ncbi:MAG: RNA polymerase sigma factor [Bacteroidetes bacterium]|nr:RNA polymerase sigma factor [Bacteroidota bacterium]
MAYKEDTFYIERILQHADNAAFAHLINKHKTMAFNIALRITGNREDAEEVAQDAFIKVFHALPGFKGDSKFTTWLFRIVYNLAISKTRKKSLFSQSVDDDHFVESGDQTEFSMNDNFSIKDRQKYVLQAINTLPEDDQLLITLYYMDDQPVDEIAAITGLSSSNVKVKLFRARKKLQEQLTMTLKDELQTIL